jgi:hypothetical protein
MQAPGVRPAPVAGDYVTSPCLLIAGHDPKPPDTTDRYGAAKSRTLAASAEHIHIDLDGCPTSSELSWPACVNDA